MHRSPSFSLCSPINRHAQLSASCKSTLLGARPEPPPPLVRARCGLQGDDGGAPAWVDAEGKLCPQEIGKAIGGMKDKALANLLAKLKRAAELDGDAQVQVCMLACV